MSELVKTPDLNSIIARVVEEKSLSCLSGEELGLVMDYAQGWESTCKLVREEVKNRLEDGVEVPGWKRISQGGQRTVRNGDLEAFGRVCTKLGIPNDRLWKCLTVSVPKVERAYIETQAGKTQAEASQEFREATADVVVQPKIRKTLRDKR